MSRLENLIYRFQSQKAHFDRPLIECKKKSGFYLEVGLGSGRTFDHVREKLPHLKRYAFDYKV